MNLTQIYVKEALKQCLQAKRSLIAVRFDTHLKYYRDIILVTFSFIVISSAFYNLKNLSPLLRFVHFQVTLSITEHDQIKGVQSRYFDHVQNYR